MAITPEQRKKLDPVLDRLVAKVKELRDLHPGVWNTTEAPHPEDYVEDDPLRHPGNTEWVGMIREENDALDEVLLEILATQIRPAPADMVKITPDKLWVWGGPTPSWGGTMADDTLVRGADYFGAENVVYVYGPTNEKMMALHSKYTRMLCQVNSLCRTKGAQGELTEEENAEYLSELSLKYPNITGAMCDEIDKIFSCKQIQDHKRNADQPHQFDTRKKAFFYPLIFLCAEILRCEIGDTVSKCGQRGYDEIVQLYRSGIARHYTGTKAVDNSLNDDISNRNKALLQNTRHSDDRNILEKL